MEAINATEETPAGFYKSDDFCVIEMTEWTSRASMDIIGVAALGKELDTKSMSESKEKREAVYILE